MPATEQPRAAAPGPAFVRPPGALPEPSFLATCTRCDDCVAACPKWSIRKAGPELGASMNGTPIVIPKEQPCWMCADMP
jgi:ferredoxin-type protein NapG